MLLAPQTAAAAWRVLCCAAVCLSFPFVLICMSWYCFLCTVCHIFFGGTTFVLLRVAFRFDFFFSLFSFDYSRVRHESALVGRPIKLSEHGPRPGPAHQFSKGRGLAISHFQNSTARSMTLVESQDRSKGRPMCCPLPQGARISAGVLFLY